MALIKKRTVRTLVGLTLVFLGIELVDELIGGVLIGAWPSIVKEFNLSYAQVGLVMTLPNVIASMIEPIMGIWGDMGARRPLILAGGVGFAIALCLIAISPTFGWFLVGFILLSPASGSFVNLCQATLMDLDPSRHEQNMARWVLAGSIGMVLGPVMLTAAIALNSSWRGVFVLLAALTGLLLLWLGQYPQLGSPTSVAHQSTDFKAGVRNALKALRQPSVLRWLILLQCSDLMLDGFAGFVALYLVDSVGASPSEVNGAIALWLGVGLVGDFLLVPLLERVRGLTYLRVSAGLVLLLYPTFLLMPHLVGKMGILGCLGFLNAGWYSILKGQLYTAMPGQSGTVVTLSNLFGIGGSLVPMMLGLFAQHLGLENALWLLILSPIALLWGLRSKAFPAD
ncbi:MAG: MFS transporter [Cyanobacteria bacterium P01_F01_bin.150]